MKKRTPFRYGNTRSVLSALALATLLAACSDPVAIEVPQSKQAAPKVQLTRYAVDVD